MQAKVFLRQLKKINSMIKNKLFEREQWKSIALGTTAHSIGERVQSSGSKQKMADAIDRYTDLEEEINEHIAQLINKKVEVISVIEQLNDVEYDVLHKIYVQELNFDDVAAMYGKSYSWVTTIHGRALKNVNDILKEKEKNNGI